ncbi:polysaccharide deacetylase family protein [Alkalihalobacillus sp. AL-G]|uniref:polysaccharide deacetylase family protein n=1 Tax=Alkalihalobacillus sp. AL-G TaxID=2926399 RepID=UPI00272BF311|nr:polysaccharide deacetylase family protein [Alkalihalobacillus sp. AL-G]WLD95004.1 polysaccharide deacetylase family protein [Alkalihalobacillus sp. AL-G]
MKQLLVLLMVSILIGCNASTVEEPTQERTETDQEQTETTENIPEDKENKPEDPPTSEKGEGEPAEPEEPKITYTISPANWTMQTESTEHEKAVLLTIDDAPDTYGLEMAQTLKELNVPAIFFINGHFIDTGEEKEVLRKIHDLGFEIGNHTMTHTNLSNLSVEEQKQEILTLNEEIEAITGEKPIFFRAPFGVNTDFSKNLVNEQNMMFMNWTFGYDWEAEYQNSQALTDIMVNTELLTNGAIILAHDREWTNEALKNIVEGLRGKGYTFIDPDQIEKK